MSTTLSSGLGTLNRSDTNSLSALFLRQPSPDSLLGPWIGKQFRILALEHDTSYGGIFSELYLLAKFSKDFTTVLKVKATDLERDGSCLLSTSILDSACTRWRGNYLWMNVNSNRQDLPAFSKVKVLDIEPEANFTGPYAFRIASPKGDTITIHCALQSPDTSMFTFAKGTAFGSIFLDDSPVYYWKTVPISNFDYAGIVLGEDSSTFFQKMKNMGVRNQSLTVTYSMSGEDSIFSAELRGKGIWGMPIDTSSAWFAANKLQAINFLIYDSVSASSTLSVLTKRFGVPTMHDSTGIISKIMIDYWFYYSSQGKLSEILFMDMGSWFTALSNLPKKSTPDIPVFSVARAMLLYCDGAGTQDQRSIIPSVIR